MGEAMLRVIGRSACSSWRKARYKSVGFDAEFSSGMLLQQSLYLMPAKSIVGGLLMVGRPGWGEYT